MASAAGAMTGGRALQAVLVALAAAGGCALRGMLVGLAAKAMAEDCTLQGDRALVALAARAIARDGTGSAFRLTGWGEADLDEEGDSLGENRGDRLKNASYS